MRENRTYGSEGGEDGSPFLPLSPFEWHAAWERGRLARKKIEPQMNADKHR